jgi:hypothetical protein
MPQDILVPLREAKEPWIPELHPASAFDRRRYTRQPQARCLPGGEVRGETKEEIKYKTKKVAGKPRFFCSRSSRSTIYGNAVHGVYFDSSSEPPECFCSLSENSDFHSAPCISQCHYVPSTTPVCHTGLRSRQVITPRRPWAAPIAPVAPFPSCV